MRLLIRGDARRLPLADRSVDCVVTSPPYFGLRDYGDPQQLGLEATPAAYVAALVDVFGEIWRVLKHDGTVWLNLGDSYAGGGTIGRNDADRNFTGGGGNHLGSGNPGPQGTRRPVDSLKPKDLCGIPWHVAFALQEAGWYLRADIIWSKPNPMPESVTDRPTKAHEYVFLLTKSERYFYDAQAIAEPADTAGESRISVATSGSYISAVQNGRQPSGNGVPGRLVMRGATRNKRSVWTVSTMPYAGAHFATMPEALVEPCILAGCPLGGVVLDPFCGSGTVLAVAERLGRHGVGVDLTYHDLAAVRTSQRGLPLAFA